MHTILSAPLHLHFGSYLPGWVTHTCCWHEHMGRQLVWASVCAQSACKHASVACVYVLLLCTLMICEAKVYSGKGERRRELRR